jgi:chemotaxis protein MotB
MLTLRRRPKRDDSDEVPEYWITYSDLMVSLLMTFALLLFLALARVQTEVGRAETLVNANKNAILVAGKALQGSGNLIALDTLTGTLSMNAEVLFAYGSAELRPVAAEQIRRIAIEFIPRLLEQPSVDSLIQEIVIEGHTDTVATYMWNLRLSQERAYAVMRAMVESTYGMPHAERLRSLVVASGKSEVRPIVLDGKIDDARSRRIEIHIRFRDDAILERILDATQPSAPGE